MRLWERTTIRSLIATGLFVAVATACGTASSPTAQPKESPTTPASAAAPEAAARPTATTAIATEAPIPTLRAADQPKTEEPATEPPTSTASAPQPAATATAEPTAVAASPVIPLDDDWEQELRQAGINTSVWETDFSKRSVPYREIFSGGVPRDGIPPIDDPNFVEVAEANEWLEENEPVIALEIEGEARAYPLQILTWHEIVNDTVNGVPVSATFCPLCNSAIVFDRRLEGVVYDFGVSGNLRNSDLIMWDRQTQSWWQQLTGEAIVGKLTGSQLDILPASIVAWQDFRQTYPEGQVLSRDTGHRRSYGSNPYVGYDEVGQSPFLFFGKEDDRLAATERVAAVTVGDSAAAFPFPFLETEGVVNHQVDGQDLVVFFKPGTRSALDQRSIADSREVGSTGIFLRDLDGQSLTFAPSGDQFADLETGTSWNIFGQGVAGPLAGQQLTPLPHANHFWFAWAAFRPDTQIVDDVP